MTDRRAVALFLLGPWFSSSFWDDVDYEVETVDVDDLAEFEAADELPIEPRADFENDLQQRLKSFVLNRYGGSGRD